MLSKNKVNQLFLDSGLKKSSANSYSNALSTIINKLAEGDFSVLKDKTEKWFKEDVFNKKFKHLKATTKRNYISSIVGWMKINKDVHNDLFKSLSTERDDLNSIYTRIIEKGEKTDYEKAQWVPASELSDIFENKILPVLKRYNLDSSNRKPLKMSEFEDKDINTIQDFVVTAFYLYPFFDPESNFGVLRNDLSGLIYYPYKGSKAKIPDDKINNFFMSTPSSGKLLMRDFKTFSSHGETTLVLPKFIAAMLRKWAIFLGLKINDIVFPNLTKVDITHILQKKLLKYSNKKISVQMLRKIYISFRFKDNQEAREEVANSMMHNVETQNEFYTKT